MKKLILLLSFVFIINETKAQYVTIPDPHFAAWLQIHFSTCMNGNQMDTVCAGGFGGFFSVITVINDSITDLTGIQYLDNLYELDCYNDQLTYIPALPVGLTVFYCQNNHLTSLPSLPSALKYFKCDQNLLTSLPTLPDSLISMWCMNNQLTSLPALPNTLTDLTCINNQLTSLPTLPNSLTSLYCGSNNISCFPQFPNSLAAPNGSASIIPNPFHCLPNYVSGMNGAVLAYPLCVSGDILNNPAGCTEVPGISGYGYKDNNSNCVFETLDAAKQNLPIKLYGTANNFLAQTNTLINGVYEFPKPNGTYTVKIDTLGMPFKINCVYPGADSTVTLTTANPLQTNINFDVACKPGFDIGIRSVLLQGIVFPGVQNVLRLDAGDMSNLYNLHCASGVSGQIVVNVIGPVTYNYSVGSLTPSVAGNTYTYTIPDFGTINSSTAFGLTFTTDTTASFGDSISVNVSVTPVSGDNMIANNNHHSCFYVGNSYDPNYKDTYPKNVGVGFIDYFTYAIHFQNVGSASAININIKDTLDNNLDLNTFQLINNSDTCRVSLTGNKLRITFPNINLPDSSSNFIGSQGFVQYRIKPKTGLLNGTQIHNKAFIYFDYNPPKITNITVNKFMLDLGINQLTMNNEQLIIYPNPSNGKFIIEVKNTETKNLKLEITNLLGAIIYQSEIHNSKSNFDLSIQPKGIYFVRIIGGTQSLNQKIMKE